MIPGLPSIPDFKGLISSGADALISFGGASLIRMIFGNQWGIFNQFGIPIMLADTVYSVKYQNSSQIAQAPVEKGTFTSYNKVQNPYQATVTLIKGGGDPTMRGLFLAQLELLSKSTLLFHVITPEIVHINAAITGYDYARLPQEGARMIAANVYLEEVREGKVNYETDETENPEDTPVEEAGEKQAEEAPQSLLDKIVDKVEGTFGEVLDQVTEAVDSAVGIVDEVTGTLDEALAAVDGTVSEIMSQATEVFDSATGAGGIFELPQSLQDKALTAFNQFSGSLGIRGLAASLPGLGGGVGGLIGGLV